MSKRGKRAVPARPRGKKILQHVDTARAHVFWASGMVDCCVYATESTIEPKNGRPNIQHALQGVHALLEKAADELMDALDDEPLQGDES